MIVMVIVIIRAKVRTVATHVLYKSTTNINKTRNIKKTRPHPVNKVTSSIIK